MFKDNIVWSHPGVKYILKQQCLHSIFAYEIPDCLQTWIADIWELKYSLNPPVRILINVVMVNKIYTSLNRYLTCCHINRFVVFIFNPPCTLAWALFHIGGMFYYPSWLVQACNSFLRCPTLQTVWVSSRINSMSDKPNLLQLVIV